MIFNRLFTPKYAHPDPAVRMSAIASLDPDKPEHKSQLHELAFNDAEARVSLAALTRLNSFDLWLKMSQIAVDKQIKKAAQQQVIETLTSPSSEQSVQQQKTNLSEIQDPMILRAVLEQATWPSRDLELLQLVLGRINDSQFTRSVMAQLTEPAALKQLLDNIDNQAMLIKLRKQVSDPKMQQVVSTRITLLEERAKRPLELQQRLKLDLAKLQALAEDDDYLTWQNRRKKLRTNIDAVLPELASLASEQADLMRSKLANIEARLDGIFTRIKPLIDAQHRAEKQAAEAQQWRLKAENILATTQLHIEQALEQLQTLENATIQTQLEQHLHAYKTLEAPQKKDKETYHALQTSLTYLAALSSDIELLIAVKVRLSTFLQQFDKPLKETLTIEQVDAFRNLESEFKQQLTRVINPVPVDILRLWDSLVEQWQGVIVQFEQRQSDNQRFCRSKIRTALALIEQGKYKPALAIYAQVNERFMDLAERQQNQLMRQFEQLRGEAEKLSDWQAYVAVPKRPELLTQMQTLASAKNIDIQERKQQVAAIRANWQSLGDVALDQETTNAFEQAAEAAFAPCREFYQQQAEKRAANKQQAIIILGELEQLAVDIDNPSLAQTYHRLRQAWYGLGELERKDWRELARRFKQLTAPLNSRVRELEKHNAQRKQQLVAHAQSILTSLPEDTATQLQRLQDQWKAVGYAGKNTDQALWTAFRQYNDEAFVALRQRQTENKNLADQRVKELQDDIQLLRDVMLQEPMTLKRADQLQQQLRKLSQHIRNDVEISAQKGALQKKLTKIETKLNDLSKTHQAAEKLASLKAVFQQLSAIVGSGESPESLGDLPFKVIDSEYTQEFDRTALTIQLEITCGRQSPPSCQTDREAQQLLMLQYKLHNGRMPSSDELVSGWLAKGPILQEEQTYLDRVQVVLMADAERF